MSDAQKPAGVPAHRLITAANQELLIVSAILARIGDKAGQEPSVWHVLSREIAAITTAAILMSGHDEAWLERQRAAATERMTAIIAQAQGDACHERNRTTADGGAAGGATGAGAGQPR